MPIDYSKWKDIEVSDDEDDTHPNIDTPSLFRWRHQARLERMAEKKLKKEELEKNKGQTNNKMKELEDKLASSTLEEKEKIKVANELAELKKQEDEWRKKEKELEDQERLEPWNVDTIAHDSFNYSRVNKVSEKKPAEAPKLNDEEDNKRMSNFFDTNESLLQQFGRIHGLKETEEFILDHPHMASEYTSNYLTIECLNLAIDMKADELAIMAEQCIIIQYLLELAKSLNGVATNTTIIKAFFQKFRKADPSYMKLFRDEVDAFLDRLNRRAKEKREAALAEYEAEEKANRVAQAPGGLDPQEVYEALPAEMRAAFDSQDVAQLQEVATSMDREVFSYHFDRCIKSGLWVPGGNEEGEEEEDNVEVVEDEDKETTVD